MSAPSPTHLAQVAIVVRDLDRAKAFYGTLGLTHLFDAPPGLSFFRCGETRLMLSQPEGAEMAGNSILYYAVPDAQAAAAALAEAGVAFEEERAASPGSRAATSGSPSAATARGICSA